jgi:hypothetical protein
VTKQERETCFIEVSGANGFSRRFRLSEDFLAWLLTECMPGEYALSWPYNLCPTEQGGVRIRIRERWIEHVSEVPPTRSKKK